MAGSVAEHSAYHHGESALMGTIINLAQNYVGSNNINLLQPCGQFGTRLQGGKDSASPRYIFTCLSPLARVIFNPHDDPLLSYQHDDNLRIEPTWYIPIVPMVLVNGALGIGTGWSTNIPTYNPLDIVNNLLRLLDGEKPTRMKPWFRNFTGHVKSGGNSSKWVTHGTIKKINKNTVEISELPVGTWTQNYKVSVLDPMLYKSDKKPASVVGYTEHHTDDTVRFVVSMPRSVLDAVTDNDKLLDMFKLKTR